MSQRIIAILATLDTKTEEAAWVKKCIEDLGAKALVLDLGVIGGPGMPADVDRAAVAAAGGKSLADLLKNPNRQEASPVMVAGAIKILLERVRSGQLHGVLGMGGTQGTSNGCAILQALPYGLPKVMISTVASGDTSAFVGIKDITMMPAVGDLLGLNPFTRRILANGAGAVVGMAQAGSIDIQPAGDKPVVGMTNLGVLTTGAMRAVQRFREKGYEVIVFHAVGSGGLAMEQMMKEGFIGAVFDYALGEISDEMFDGLRAAGPERLTVAGQLGLPQVLCPGGAEHIGLLVEPNQVPDLWKDNQVVFHNPIILAPRLDKDRWCQVAREIGKRLTTSTSGKASMMLPLAGTSSYGIKGGPLHDPAGDRAFFEALRASLPDCVGVQEFDMGAEDDSFVDACVDRLIALMEG
ncbi:MAG: Tm-1-like ATP-binding domain-containing protein [Planctomycetota bacterium]|nr:Tm-1-like ATP-binding domain-containing protein [Planctomycetota bacterium]